MYEGGIMLKKTCVGLVALCLATEAFGAYQMTVPQAFYYYAQKGDLSGIQKLKSQGYSIDASNANGNSALCESVYRQDYSSFVLLRQAGASTNHSCMRRIPSETARQFNEGYVKWAEGVNSGKISYAGATTQTTKTTAKAATATTGSEGGSVVASVPTWAWWTGGILLAAGGAAAIAGGGGGGGGGGSKGCPTGYTGTSCNVCAEGYGRDGAGNCVLKGEDLIGKTASNNNNGIIELENDQYRDVIGLEGSYGQVDDGTSVITEVNTGDGTVYGIYGSNFIYGSYTNSGENQTATNTVTQTNNGDGDIYGIYGSNFIYGSCTNSGENQTAINTITQTNIGNGSVYGIYASDSVVAGTCVSSGSNITAANTITQTNKGNGSIYGMYGSHIQGAYAWSGSNDTITNKITQINNGNGSVYGIYGLSPYVEDLTHGAYALSGSNHMVTNTIDQINNGGGDIYGIQGGIGSTYGAYASSGSNQTAINTITQKNTGIGTTYGMYGQTVISSESSSNNTATNTINITSTGGNAVGIYGKKSITHAVGDTITINYFGGKYTVNTDTVAPETDTTFAAGLYVPQNASATNRGNIIIKREAWTDDNGTTDTSDDITYTPTGRTGKAYGIYVEGNNTSSKTIQNDGNITLSGVDDAYGIYVANGTNVTVKNTGTITIDGVSCSNCSGTITSDRDNYIVLNGGTLLNAGSMSTSSLSSASMGGKLVATKGAQFNIEDEMSGDLNISADLTTQGFNTTYVEKDMINAGDTSGLNLISESALFDASLADNGHDVVMSMKSFDAVTENASFAKFLTQNYAGANNEKFFNMLKEMATKSALTDAFDKLMGKEMLSRFAFEDMTMMRELNFDMNNNLFNMKEDHLSMAGSVSSPMAFKGDTGSNSRYTLTNKTDGIWSVGLGVAFTDIRSDNDNKNTRLDSMYQMIVPIGYKAGGFKFVTSPRLGYARGTYDRTGFNDKTYDGTIEKRIFGLMNEARYPITFGDWRFEPTAEFNMLGYEQKGHEEAKEYSLYIPTQRTYSVESGVGLYATHETNIKENGKVKFMAGASAYHEFVDPYKMDVGMRGMNGAFTLRDEKRTDNRAVARAGFNYDTNGYGISASVISYIDRETRAKANLGFKWKF